MTHLLQEPDRDPASLECAYNLFRYAPCDLLCAVPEMRPVPNFIRSPAWRFVGALESHEAAPPGFDVQAARTGIRYNGFHLFLQTARDRLALRDVVVVGVAVPAWDATGADSETAKPDQLNDNALVSSVAAVGSC